jgi:hypothetical protein
MKLFAGIILFGSLWGFSECIIGGYLSEIGLPSGSIMTGVFAISFLVISRLYFRKPGMQLGMGLVAGALRYFNPFFVACPICPVFAIIAEGAIFEVIWRFVQNDYNIFKSRTMQVSLGIFSVYCMYVGGTIITQILTPLATGVGFYIENIIIFIPSILSNGIIPALIGAVVLPISISSQKLDIKIKDHFYYPTTIGLSIICWIIVIGSWAIFSF